MQLSGDNFPRWELPGGIVLGGLFGGNCPGGQLSLVAVVRGLLSGGQLFGG